MVRLFVSGTFDNRSANRLGSVRLYSRQISESLVKVRSAHKVRPPEVFSNFPILMHRLCGDFNPHITRPVPPEWWEVGATVDETAHFQKKSVGCIRTIR